MSSSKLQALADRWAIAKAAERANAQSYIIELCDALAIERPRPAGSGYEFELPIKVVNRDGTESSNFVDCYKEGCFVLEAKDAEDGRSTDVLLRKAYGQARTYAAHVPGGSPPPYILVLDVGKTLLVWDRWNGSFGGYGAARRIDLTALARNADAAALLRDVWTNPAARDPRSYAQAVTRDIAAHLAELAASLERRDFGQERVARFLMRCVFTMFAEDVALLPDEPFRRILDEVALANPEEFAGAAEELWRAMDEGRRFGFRKLLRFNGHFFKDAEALPLTRADLATLLEAAKADWSKVEPSIFGTLLTRALDPEERHRLGAEYTPPEFIERLVRPTVEEPIRERWTAVQAEVLQLRESKKAADKKRAIARVRQFHEWLRGLRFLDPACGSGNFLYVTMHTVKRIEVEVLNELADLTGALELRYQEVDPSQFWGIEVKPWAREIAELTLWIGFHQFWRQHHAVQPEEPLLRDTGTLENRDAILAWDGIRHDVRRDRPDPTPRVRDHITGDMVPDPAARLPYLEHLAARPAAWPNADFIIGNPPYLGAQRHREVFGDGYVEALRAAYPDVPDGADLVMYWWFRAAQAVASGQTIRAGLITTNSIVQTQNRSVVSAASDRGARVTWAIPDHVWYEGGDGAEVRVAMTVVAKEPARATLVTVERVERVRGHVPILSTTEVPSLNPDLTAFADVATASTVPLRSNAGLAFRGVYAMGDGFFLDGEEARELLAMDPRHSQVIRRIRNGKDLTARPRDVFLIDFALMSEEEAREYPVVFDLVRARVKPVRDANAMPARRNYWWRLGSPGREVREATRGLERYIVTAMTAKHRTFHFVSADMLPDQGVVAIASDDAYVLGVLSSRFHRLWALAAGGRMGVRHTPRYNNAVCFTPYPFPDASVALRREVAQIAEAIERHRSAAMLREDSITVMRMYDAIAAVAQNAPLNATLRRVYQLAACATLAEMHSRLDALVADCYGWPQELQDSQVLEQLVNLHDERAQEEANGRVRWLRPEVQTGLYRVDDVPAGFDLESELDQPGHSATVRAWPADVVDQITELRRLAGEGPLTVDGAVSRFVGAPRTLVVRHLETLAILGELRPHGQGRYSAARAAA